MRDVAMLTLNVVDPSFGTLARAVMWVSSFCQAVRVRYDSNPAAVVVSELFDDPRRYDRIYARLNRLWACNQSGCPANNSVSLRLVRLFWGHPRRPA